MSKAQTLVSNNDKKFESDFLKVEYWVNEMSFESAVETARKMRKFKDYFECDIDKLVSKGFNPTNIDITLHGIQKQLLTFKFNKISELPYFEFSNRCINYWLFRGWSETEAKDKVHFYQSNNGKKRAEQMKELKESDPQKFKEQLSTTVEFYLAKGMTQEDAEKALKDRQSTFSKKNLIEKYGEEVGLKKLDDRNTKWFKTLKENNDWDELTKKKVTSSNGLGKASKESLTVFNPVYECLLDNGFEKHDLYLGIEGSNEWFISTRDNFYMYDFTIRSKKIIVEYNGTNYHPREGDTEWRSLVGVTYDEALKKDKSKIMLAKDQGFKVLEIWSDETNNIEKVINFIKENCNE
jgi:hypothetical protein